MRRILVGLISVLSVFLLSGCFGFGGDDPGTGSGVDNVNYSAYSTDDFLIRYPRNWKDKKGNELNDDIRSTVEVAFVSNFKDSFFTPVITVEKIALGEDGATLSSSDFADLQAKYNEESLVNYDELERSDLSLVVGGGSSLTKLIRFQAKERLQDDTIEFLQVYLASGGFGYTVTGAYDPHDEDSEAAKIVESLRSFSLK